MKVKYRHFRVSWRMTLNSTVKMTTHTKHTERETFYFVTFTCYKWLPLFDTTQLYDYFESWLSHLAKRGVVTCGHVFMPNHLHLLVYINDSCEDFNKVIGEGKRFMAYEIVKRLEQKSEVELLDKLSLGVRNKEKTKGKKHQVFRLSFDAKEVTEDEIPNVLDYIHHNPVSGKWSLVDDFVDFPYSSAKYYEEGKHRSIPVTDYRSIFDELNNSESSTE